MTSRRLLRAHIRRVAISTIVRLLKLIELFFNGCDFGIGRFLIVLVARNARGDRNIGRQSPERAGARYVDVTGGAFHNVFALAALVIELCGLAHRQIDRHKRRGGFMATGAVIADRFLTFPMAVEAVVVTVGHGSERPDRWFENTRRAWGGHVDEGVFHEVTD